MDPVTAFVAAYMTVATNCASRDAVRQLLQGRYGEKPIAEAVDSNGNVMQIFANPRTQTYTIVVTAPDGLACMINSGDAFRSTETPL